MTTKIFYKWKIVESVFVHKMLTLVIFYFVGTLESIVAQEPSSPCPSIFEYRMGSDGQLYGSISVSKPENYEKVELHVRFQVPNKVNGGNGRIDLLPENPQDSFMNYNLYFPYWERYPPRIIGIFLNNQLICTGPPFSTNMYRTVTTVDLWNTRTRVITQTPCINGICSEQPVVINFRPASPKKTTKIFSDLDGILKSFEDITRGSNPDVSKGQNSRTSTQPMFAPFWKQITTTKIENPFLNSLQGENSQPSYPIVTTRPVRRNDGGYLYLWADSTNNWNNNNYNDNGNNGNPPSSFPNTNINNGNLGNNSPNINSNNRNPVNGSPNVNNRIPADGSININNNNEDLNNIHREPNNNFDTNISNKNTLPNVNNNANNIPPINLDPIYEDVDTNTPRSRTKSSYPYSDVCGSFSDVNQLIYNGKTVSNRFEFPWLVAMYKKSLGLTFICGGSLISNKHIVTAGHCLQENGKTVSPQQLVMLLGRKNLESWTNNDGARLIEPKKLVIHPEYKKFSADADIAVVILSEEVEFTPYIKPVCLWLEDNSLERIVNQRGVVVGWGRDENGEVLSLQPKQLTMPIVAQDECLRSNAAFRVLTSNRSFCAGYRNNSGPCNGDSGGGFVMKMHDKWILRGVITYSLTKADKICNLNEYVVFTDASKFTDWLLSFLT